VLHLFSKLKHCWFILCDVVLFDTHEILQELFLRITFDVFNFLYFNLEQITFLVLVNIIVLNEKICDDFQNMRLEKRNKHEYTIFVLKNSAHFIEVSITHFDSSLFCINRNSIKSTLIDSILEFFIFICFKISDISYLIDNWETFRLTVFHLFDDGVFVIDTDYVKI